MVGWVGQMWRDVWRGAGSEGCGFGAAPWLLRSPPQAQLVVTSLLQALAGVPEEQGSFGHVFPKNPTSECCLFPFPAQVLSSPRTWR